LVVLKTIGRAKVVIVTATKTIAVFSLSYISFIELITATEIIPSYAEELVKGSTFEVDEFICDICKPEIFP